MRVRNATTKKLTGHALLATSAIRPETPWKDVELVPTPTTGGMFPKDTPVSAETNRFAGDATTVTSIMLKVMPANVVTRKWTGVARIATEISPRDMLATNVTTRKLTGIARTAVGILQKVMRAKNVITSKWIGTAKNVTGSLQKDTHARNVEANNDLLMKWKHYLFIIIKCDETPLVTL